MIHPILFRSWAFWSKIAGLKIFSEQIANADELLEIALTFRLSKTIFAAVEYRLFDWLTEKPHARLN